MSGPVLAVDFGTSNSAAAMLFSGAVRRIPIEDGADTLPTAVFFPEDGGAMRIGRAAQAALIDAEEGRYMRALKSILGTELFHQSRLIEGKRRTLAEIVTAFLVALKTRAETETGLGFSSVLSGRPVHFHSDDAEKDRRAEEDLRGCYLAAGFDEVTFLPEPEAAAWACREMTGDGLGLIVDIGGGTSDFSVFRASGVGIEILANHGIRLGGTDFDQRISVAHVMPLLGQGGQVTRTFGEGLLPLPSAIYQDLATWPKIPFLYNRDTERLVEDLLVHAVEPDKVGRLKSVIEEHLGHEMAFAVEAGKIAANGDDGRADILLGFVEKGLATPITKGSMNGALGEFRDKLRAAVYQTLMQAQVAPMQIDTIVLVGGSSLMQIVQEDVQAICTSAKVEMSEAFTAVVDGLALASGDG